MSTREAALAARRFGLGPKPGDLKRIASDPQGYLLAALERKDAAVIVGSNLEPSHAVWRTLREATIAEQAAREGGREGGPKGPAEAGRIRSPSADTVLAQPRGAASPGPKPGQIRREVEGAEFTARLERAVGTDQPFLERLVMFWSNHFCVSTAKGLRVRVLAGAFEREAIRPQVLGRFADMLKAVERHPAMLIYLDNSQSTGPNSRAGRERGRGLNENLAREILELHTLGVDGGYRQADVTNLARIITGWTVAGLNQSRVEPGRYLFAQGRHEPGAWEVLGKRYEEGGALRGVAVLDDLARHPATARRIARKLATHFVGDDSPPALVARLETSFRDSDGDLAAVSRALATAPECWQQLARKIVPPYDFVVALMRGFQLDIEPAQALAMAGALGQPLWRPPSPKGWPDDDVAWMGPSAMRERLRIAHRLGRAIDSASDPRAVAQDLFGEHLSHQAQEAIARAETREQGFALLVMSPEFQRR
jgi:uncharacterized protein (DUF1800 family)